MAGISSISRDLAAVKIGLNDWLAAQWPDKEIVSFGNFRTNAEGGFSSESLIFDVRTRDSAGNVAVRSLVARLPPNGQGIFREYDFEMQFKIQLTVRDAGIPVPEQVGYSDDPKWIGVPFLVMDYVPGRIPPNQPMYNVSGWLKALSAKEQAKGHAAVLECMAKIHSTSFRRSDVMFLRRPRGTGLVAEFDWYSDYVNWAADGNAPAEVNAVQAWCQDRLPALSSPDCVCWGDARLGNVLFNDTMGVAALLDWEMATFCPAEVDLGWFLGFRRQIRARTGEAGSTELPGFPAREAVIQQYESLLGRDLLDLTWFEVFAMLRLAGMVLATKKIVKSLGITDHFILGFAPIEPWVLELIEALFHPDVNAEHGVEILGCHLVAFLTGTLGSLIRGFRGCAAR